MKHRVCTGTDFGKPSRPTPDTNSLGKNSPRKGCVAIGQKALKTERKKITKGAEMRRTMIMTKGEDKIRK